VNRESATAEEMRVSRMAERFSDDVCRDCKPCW